MAGIAAVVVGGEVLEMEGELQLLPGAGRQQRRLGKAAQHLLGLAQLAAGQGEVELRPSQQGPLVKIETGAVVAACQVGSQAQVGPLSSVLAHPVD